VPEYYVYSPNIFKDGSTYYLVYDVALNSSHGSCERITYATASSPLGPYTKGPVILDIGAAGQFDDGRVAEPFVFKDNGTYYLFYMGDHYPYGNKEEIALATTSAADFPLGPGGGNWTKYGLILGFNPDPNSWDRGLDADPSVIKVGSTFYMLYTGSYANTAWKEGVAWCTSPYGPWNRPSAPNLPLGPAGSWDSSRLVRGAIHYNSYNGKYVLPYSGTDGSGYKGGIATADPYVPITFETRTSPDGSTWENWKPVTNGSNIQSTPSKYFQYRATLYKGPLESPTLTSVTIDYQSSHAKALYMNPSLMEKTRADIHTTFDVNITTEDVIDLFGFDLNITWNNALTTFAGVEFDTWLDAIWGHDGWFLASNETGPGWYALSATSISASYTGPEAKPLATMKFRVEDAPPGETPIHFALAKLGNSKWTPIPVDSIRDATYRMLPSPPETMLRINPDLIEKTYSDIGMHFNVSITIENITDLFGLDFNITWDNTLITHYTCYYNETLDAIWGSDNWQLIKSESGIGWYKIVALSTKNGFTKDPGIQALFTLEFLVEDPHTTGVKETPVHFATHKLSDSGAEPISHLIEDAKYRIAINVYTLTVSVVGSGSVTRNDTGPNYHYGDAVLLTAVPGMGWSFDHWSGDLSGSASPATLVITGNMSVTATFVQINYTLTVSVVGSGSVSLNNTGPYHYGDPVELKATPSAGWVFQCWSGGLSGSANPATLVMTGNFSVSGNFIQRPMLQMDPGSKTCRKYGEGFTVAVSVFGAVNVENFEFEIHYNTTLLDFAGVAWNAWGSGTINVDRASGNVTGSTAGIALNGSFEVITLEFRTSCYRVWKDESTILGWKNDQTGTISIQWANVSYPSGPDLRYERGGIGQIDVGPDFAYTFSPIQGDVNNDGTVDIFDLRTVASYYGVKEGDLLWSEASKYDLTKPASENIIDISDLIMIAGNFGFEYDC
jgi:hypothetical protein